MTCRSTGRHGVRDRTGKVRNKLEHRDDRSVTGPVTAAQGTRVSPAAAAACTPCFVHVEVSGDAELVQQGSGTPRLYRALQCRAHVVQKHEMTERGRTEVHLNHGQSHSTFRRLRWRRNGANSRHRRLGQPRQVSSTKRGIEHKRKGSSSPGRFKAAQRGAGGPGRPRARQRGLGVSGGAGAPRPQRGGRGHVAGPGSNKGFTHHTVVTGTRCTAGGRQGRFWAPRRYRAHGRAWLKRRAQALRQDPRNPLTILMASNGQIGKENEPTQNR